MTAAPIMNNEILKHLWRLTPGHMAEKLTAGRFKRFAHIEYLSQHIARTIAQGNGRIIISMPPRHGKSWLTSLWTPTWFLSLNPEQNVILTSYEADFAATWGRQVRNLITEHGPTLSISLTTDSKAADRWNTPQGGGMVTAGVGGPITGRGGHLIIVDDPIKNSQEAYSETHRRKAIEWFNSTLYTRAEPGATIIVLMTRWHEGDLAGHLLNNHEDKWSEVRLPALAEESDPLGRAIGEPLCGERFNAAALDDIKKAVGSKVWASLYQQRPAPDAGNLILRSWFRHWHILPQRFDEKIQTWDLTFGDKENSDFVVGQVWGRIGADKYLIDQVRARMDFPTTIRAVRSLSAKHPDAWAKIVEEKANGAALIATLKNEIAGLIPVNPQTSKEMRIMAVSPVIEAGNVYLPDPAACSWVTDFIEEVVQFPKAKHDDCADCMSMALLRFQTSRCGTFTEDYLDCGNTFADSFISRMEW
jgi:predicted phage terminase large subunit-like protein